MLVHDRATYCLPRSLTCCVFDDLESDNNGNYDAGDRVTNIVLENPFFIRVTLTLMMKIKSTVKIMIMMMTKLPILCRRALSLSESR